MWSSATASRSYDLPVRIVDRLIATSLPVVPRPVVRRFADRYMAGERLDDAVATVAPAEPAGRLGDRRRAGRVRPRPRRRPRHTVEQYLEALDAIARTGLDANVSVKLTAVGLEIEPALALGNVRQIVEAAAGSRQLRPHRHGALRRHRRDARRLHDAAPRGLRQRRHRPPVVPAAVGVRRPQHGPAARRACAWSRASTSSRRRSPTPTPGQINASFERLIEELADIGSHIAAATHDERADRGDAAGRPRARRCRATCTSSRCCSACARGCATG